MIDQQFKRHVTDSNFPLLESVAKPLDDTLLLDLFDSQCLSRHLDLQARLLKQDNLGFYTIASSGHEANAALGAIFTLDDMAFLHYRSGAFMVQRAKQDPSVDILYDTCLALVASAEDPIASGRHKVFGSLALNVPPQTSTIASHLPKAVGTAFSLNLAKELNINTKMLKDDSVVLCSFGDASVNHSTAQGAFQAARWIEQACYPLGLVFVCEDNGWGISVPTPKEWIQSNFANDPFLHYIQADGLNIEDTYAKTKAAYDYAKQKRKPVFLHIKTVRLMGHAGSDIESVYRTKQDIQQTEFHDPLLHSAHLLVSRKILSQAQVLAQYEAAREKVRVAASRAMKQPRLDSATAVMASLIPPVSKRSSPPLPKQSMNDSVLKRNMAQCINLALADLMNQYDNAVIFGEDVGHKGGVYHVTADLQKRFGARRVFDSPLDEQTILGTAIGLAHNGFLPVPEIQYLAYLHNAEDQLRGEAATLSYFSNGQFTNPMVIRIASFAYQKGFGGHFHNDNSIAVLRDIPGIIIACPSNGADAAKMLRHAFYLAYTQQRIVVFLEPIALYMTKDDWLCDYPALDQQIQCDEIGVYGEGEEIVVISYGNGFYLSWQAMQLLKQNNITIKLIDIRWLAPLPEKALLNELKKAKHVIIVDECRKTGSLSEALITLIVEHQKGLPSILRISGKDTFIPLGDAWQFVLPSTEEIIKAVLAIA